MEELKSGEEINGRYVLKESKGRGTFGEVWLCHDRATDEDVAIKFYVALDHKGREEFIQEFRIAAELRHKNLLVTKDYGEWNGHPYLTMKYCDNGSAADLIGSLNPGKEDEMKIWRFIRDVASGLAYLHSVKPDPIVHQDIKPDNILVDADGTFLITDFGISKRIRNTMRKQSTRALKAGAPAYMGPERFSENPEPILASDVWSLGVSIYELAEGELPFSGMGGIMMTKGAEIPSLSPGWSRNLSYVMNWCLEKETWSRAKASQVQEAADAVIASGNSVCLEMPVHHEYNGAKTVISHHEYNDAKPVIPDSALPFWKRTKIWVAAVAIVAVLFTIGMVAWLWRDENQKESAVVDEDELVTEQDSVMVIEQPDVEEQNGYEQEVKETDTSKETSTAHSGNMAAKKPSEQSNGTLELGYATWNGGIKNGKPNGKGTMTFSTSHVIDSRDSNKRVAEAGERIEGNYINGHLDDGRWFKSDGSTEYILLGE